MEEETGYAAEEIIKYHKSNGDIMGLLCKVRKPYKSTTISWGIEESGKGYTQWQHLDKLEQKEGHWEYTLI